MLKMDSWIEGEDPSKSNERKCYKRINDIGPSTVTTSQIQDRNHALGLCSMSHISIMESSLWLGINQLNAAIVSYFENYGFPKPFEKLKILISSQSLLGGFSLLFMEGHDVLSQKLPLILSLNILHYQKLTPFTLLSSLLNPIKRACPDCNCSYHLTSTPKPLLSPSNPQTLNSLQSKTLILS